MSNLRTAPISDYIPQESEANDFTRRNGPASSGAVFVSRPADPATLAILEARKHALRNPRLTMAMKACFCEVLDRSLDPEFFDKAAGRGVVTISDTVLAEVFNVSNRSIYDWKKRIEAEGLWWITRKFKNNMWPITTYHLSCLHRPKRDGKTDADGTYGGRKFRQPPTNPGLGARRPGQPNLPLAKPSENGLPGSHATPLDEKTADLQATSALGRDRLRLSPAENFGSEPQPTSGAARSQLRARAEADCGPEPKRTAGRTRSADRPPPEADCEQLRDSEGRSRDQETEKAVNRLANRSGGLGKAKAAPGEDDFMLLALETLGRKEMMAAGPTGRGNGGLWRTLFRQNPEKAWRVIRDVAATLKESPKEIRTSPARFAMDLWQRFE